MYSKVTLILPQKSEGIRSPIPLATPLYIRTTISLVVIKSGMPIVSLKYGIPALKEPIIQKYHTSGRTNILSANGSSHSPTLLVIFQFLATHPSSKSEIAIATNTAGYQP